MDGAKGSALEWALALLHAPGERHALRQKPLPEGMAALLGIAAGAMPAELAEAARAFNAPEARIREAAQFYVREVLFFPQADAYRVLGVDAHASAASIKAHHRLLQHWLHPDRLQSEDDAIFASRVNVAWNRLRTPERREAYDRTLQDELLPQAFENSAAVGSLRAWVPDAEIHRNPWRHRLPVLALTASCMLLAVMVLRDKEDRPEGWEGKVGESPDGMAAGRLPEISVPRHVAPVAPDAAARRLPAPVRPVGNAIADPIPPTIAARAVPAIPSTPPAQLQPPLARENAIAAARPRSPAPQPVPALQASVAASAPAVVPPPQGSARDTVDAPSESPPVPARAAQADSPRQVLPSYGRIQQAWAAGDQLLRFMAGVGRSSPPIWSSPGIQSSADRLRQDMHGAGGVRLSGPQWQIGDQNAVLTSGYVVQGAEAGAGRLTADLVWREDRWLVVGLSIERAP